MNNRSLIPYKAFAGLRLRQFVVGSPLEKEIQPRADWEFMGGLWQGEAISFSEFLCLESRPEELGSVSLNAEELPVEVVTSVLAKLQLPVKVGMRKEEVESILGQPDDQFNFVEDRVSYEYVLGTPEPYLVRLTIQNAIGLSYVVVTRGDMLALCNEDA